MSEGPRVLVVGGTGMLGGMLWSRLSSIPGWKVRRTQRRDRLAADFFDALEPAVGLEALIRSGGGADYVLNAIGLTKPEIDEASSESVSAAKAINAQLPWRLAEAAASSGARLIHISTDGVFSGEAGPYDEYARPDPRDVYGQTKLEGEVAGPRALTIRCSIIGPDPDKGRGLFEWFRALGPSGTARGFTDQVWNGVTTTQFADLCRAIVEEKAFERITATAGIRHFCPNKPVTKFELLNIFKRETGSAVQVEPAQSGLAANRVLTSRWSDLTDLIGGPADVAAAVAQMLRAKPPLSVVNRR